MQRCQRRAQVVRDVGEQFAPLLVLQRQLAPLLGDALRHLRERLAKLRNFVMPARQPRQPRRLGLQRVHALGFEALDRHRQLAQRPCDQAERGQARKQTQQGHEAHQPQGGAQHRSCRRVGDQRVVVFALQHHIDIARIAAVHAQRGGAEHLAHIGTARIVAHDGQGRAREQLLHRLQIDPVAPEMARRRGLGLDASVEPQKIDLHARVHRHELVEQVLHRALVQPARFHQFGVLRDVRGQAAGQALYHFLLMLAVGAQLQPDGGAAAHQQQGREHHRQAPRQGGPGHHDAPSPWAAADIL